ncbi:MAG: NADH-quinone oxidoreductase subunit N [bacterium]|nr:NADH-quinone oxidoreductase subunit N [bacterium]
MEFSIEQILHSLRLTSPLLVLIFAAMAVLVADVLLPRAHRWTLALIGMAGIGLALVALYWARPPQPMDTNYLELAFGGTIQAGYLTFLAHNVILATGLFLILISPNYLAGRAVPHGEYYALLLLATLAMMALASSNELLTLFLNIELLSITLYILTGIEKNNLRSSEAGFKYFLLGSFAAAFLLLGIGFVYGATGQTRFDAIGQAIAAGRILNPAYLAIGVGLLMIGLGFKLTLAPFHMYAPDVYEGAPTPIAAAIATGSKVGGFVVFFNLMAIVAGWRDLPQGLWVALYAIVAASMVVGNVGAIVQPNLKRLLAYSSIAHSGYTLVPMVVLLRRPDLLAEARVAVAYYLLAYTLMTLLVFGVATTLGPLGEGRISHYAGLGRRSPALAMIMALALVSLVGVPPTVGFFGKLRLFSVAIEGDHIRLAVLGVLASVASAFYYLRVTVTMYMEEPSPEAGERLIPAEGVNFVILTVGAVGVFVFAVFPWLYLFAA